MCILFYWRLRRLETPWFFDVSGGDRRETDKQLSCLGHHFCGSRQRGVLARFHEVIFQARIQRFFGISLFLPSAGLLGKQFGMLLRHLLLLPLALVYRVQQVVA